jgi:hypothetical protein
MSGMAAASGFPSLTAAGITEDFISLIDLFETLFRSWIVAVEIGMPTAGLPAKGLLEAFGVSARLKPKNSPVVHRWAQ